MNHFGWHSFQDMLVQTVLVGRATTTTDLGIADAELDVTFVVSGDYDLNVNDAIIADLRHRTISVLPVLATSRPLVSIATDIGVAVPAMCAVPILGTIRNVARRRHVQESMARHWNDEEGKEQQTHAVSHGHLDRQVRVQRTFGQR